MKYSISQTCLCDARRQVTTERCDIFLYSEGKQGIWQRRFREHQIRNKIDFNPDNHGLVKSPVEWQYSSFHRQVKQGAYDSGWRAGVEIKFDVKIGHE